MRTNHLRVLCSVLNTDLVLENEDGILTAFSGAVEDSPLMKCEQLRTMLRINAANMNGPFVYEGIHECYFAAMISGNDVLYMGPMCHIKLNTVRRRQMARQYDITTQDLRELPSFTLPEIRDMVQLAMIVLGKTDTENEDLLYLNRLIERDTPDDRKGQTDFVLNEEAENDRMALRHSYHEEKQLMEAIRHGETEEAVSIAESMDRDSGRLSRDQLSHHRNLAIVGIALCARAAIDGGITPETAYRISGYYIQKCDSAESPAVMLQNRNQAIRELSTRVREKTDRSRSSSYVERCQDYIRKHYREKIYLEDIAESLGLSPTYLSKLYHKETGTRIQDAINEERVFRAANLLAFSDMSLTAIAAYVNFPNQSYFGKIFRQFKGMTPKKYRDRYAIHETAE